MSPFVSRRSAADDTGPGERDVARAMDAISQFGPYDEGVCATRGLLRAERISMAAKSAPLWVVAGRDEAREADRGEEAAGRCGVRTRRCERRGSKLDAATIGVE